MYGYPSQMPMMPLAHMMNNPMAAPGYVANAKKPDFPPDMQPIFVIPQIAHIKTTTKPKCRKYDPVLGKGLKAEWIMEKFEDEYEREEREAQEQNIERPSRLPLKVITKLIKKKIHKDKIDTLLKQWNPFENNTSDPYKTLFVARLNYAVSEKKLRREFEQYGPIKSVKIIRDSTDKPRGYAFIEFEHKNDMKTAYKYANGKRIEPDQKPTPRYVNGKKVEYDKRILVDIERGRTIMKFRPRRLGGTLGDLRRSKSEEERKIIEDRIERERDREYEALKLKKGFISVLSLMIRKVRRVSQNETGVSQRRRRSIHAKKTIYPQRKDKHARPRKASMRSPKRRNEKYQYIFKMQKIYKAYLVFKAIQSKVRGTVIYGKYKQLREELEDQKLNRICVGEDRAGNKFYQYYSYYGLPTKREIKFVDDKNKVVNDLAYYDWLYKRVEAPPTVEELEQFYLEQEKRYRLAREWDSQQDQLMNSFREQRKLKEEEYKKQIAQKITTDTSEIFQEVKQSIEDKPFEWKPKNK